VDLGGVFPVAKLISALSVLGVLMVAGPGVAHADPDSHSGWGFGHDRPAPEPLTVIGLALGAGGLIGGRRLAKRKTR
jgi:hypothetical protein